MKTVKLETEVVNEKDLSCFNYYIDFGDEFDASTYNAAYDVNLTQKQIERVEKEVKKLKEGESLFVSHTIE